MSIESIIFLALFLLLPLIERVLQGQRNRKAPPPAPQPRRQGTPGRLPGQRADEWPRGSSQLPGQVPGQTWPPLDTAKSRPTARQPGTAPPQVPAPHPDYAAEVPAGTYEGPSAEIPDGRYGRDAAGRSVTIESRPPTAPRRNPNQRRRRQQTPERSAQDQVRLAGPLDHPRTMRAYLRHPDTFRRAVVLATVLNPCRTNDPYQS